MVEDRFDCLRAPSVQSRQGGAGKPGGRGTAAPLGPSGQT